MPWAPGNQMVPGIDRTEAYISYCNPEKVSFKMVSEKVSDANILDDIVSVLMQ